MIDRVETLNNINVCSFFKLTSGASSLIVQNTIYDIRVIIQNGKISNKQTFVSAYYKRGLSPVIRVAVSYEDVSFFRRLFKRLTGLTPSQYRRMFKPVINL